jgi:hypothetical protein
MAINISIPMPSASMLTLSGAKTYLVALGTIAFAGLSYWKGTMDLNTAVTYALSAGGLGALRHGLSTAGAMAVEKIVVQVIAAIQAMPQPAAPPVVAPPDPAPAPVPVVTVVAVPAAPAAQVQP